MAISRKLLVTALGSAALLAADYDYRKDHGQNSGG